MTGKSAGFDFGLSCFLTSGDNERIKSPEFLKQSLKQLKAASKRLSAKIKGSKTDTKQERYYQDFIEKLVISDKIFILN